GREARWAARGAGVRDMTGDGRAGVGPGPGGACRGLLPAGIRGVGGVPADGQAAQIDEFSAAAAGAGGGVTRAPAVEQMPSPRLIADEPVVAEACLEHEGAVAKVRADRRRKKPCIRAVVSPCDDADDVVARVKVGSEVND